MRKASRDADAHIEEAMAIIEKGKRTLREARARQHQVKMNRQYYKTEVVQEPQWPFEVLPLWGQPQNSQLVGQDGSLEQ